MQILGKSPIRPSPPADKTRCYQHTTRGNGGICRSELPLGAVTAVLPRGPLLLGTLLVIGFAALALFPNYYSFSQELTKKHQGKVSGALGCCFWLSVAPVHEAVGETVQQTGSYAVGMTAAGVAPLAGGGGGGKKCSASAAAHPGRPPGVAARAR